MGCPEALTPSHTMCVTYVLHYNVSQSLRNQTHDRSRLILIDVLESSQSDGREVLRYFLVRSKNNHTKTKINNHEENKTGEDDRKLYRNDR